MMMMMVMVMVMMMMVMMMMVTIMMVTIMRAVSVIFGKLRFHLILLFFDLWAIPRKTFTLKKIIKMAITWQIDVLP